MENDFNLLFQYNPLPNWVYDVTTFEILDANQAAIHFNLLSPQESSRMKLDLERLAETEDTVHLGIYTHTKKSGEELFMDLYGKRVWFAGRQACLISGVPVTEQHRQLAALQDSAKQLSTITSIAQLGYWRLELDGKKLT